MKQAVLIFICTVLISYVQSCSYRSLCGDHTMCKYQVREPTFRQRLIHRWKYVICITAAERSYQILWKSATFFLRKGTSAKYKGFSLGLSFLTQGYGRNCGKPIYSGVTSGVDKQTIVGAHNNLRRHVAQGGESRGRPGAQPPAANMKKFVSRVLKIRILLYCIHLDRNLFQSLTYSGSIEPAVWRMCNIGDQWTLSPNIGTLLW
jgi:hypothetical protein